MPSAIDHKSKVRSLDEVKETSGLPDGVMILSFIADWSGIELAGLDMDMVVDQQDLKGLPVSRIELIRTGKWSGHRDGPFSITPEHLKEFKLNFDDGAKQISGDYDHADAFGKGGGPDLGSKASGWIIAKSMTIENNAEGGLSLFAKIAWTPPAAKLIKNREYRFISPAFNFKTIDKQTGKNKGVALDSFGLVNHPFIDGMAPIGQPQMILSESYALAEHPASEDGKPEERDTLEEDMPFTPEEMQAIMAMLGVTTGAEAVAKMKEMFKSERVGEADLKPEEVAAKFLSLKGSNETLNGNVSRLEKENRTLKVDATKGKEAVRSLELKTRDDLIQKALADKSPKICPADVDGWEPGNELKDDANWAAVMAEKQPDQFAKMLASKAKSGKPGKQGTGNDGEPETDLNSENVGQHVVDEAEKLMKLKDSDYETFDQAANAVMERPEVQKAMSA